ncbi:hypothetical protein EIN_386500 [Entamoeba invadens IP1]|uniref:Leucine rich repeat containing protein BspA family protein n=1 Tax=Entamoeba invadens IP1 TaxID=370355 RepID=A0A0A1UDW8_ENTIV|nr:hypothetical protein EIN_386500 [Entamoeba invadens IP1]ELP91986.1 hypothetical protein EIN_386500 [Entamoeba invadens IP1]|eukprot:XP_004258757.1 hypothetical protein EIN_386500 [Entamoeba invadens IP1]
MCLVFTFIAAIISSYKKNGLVILITIGYFMLNIFHSPINIFGIKNYCFNVFNYINNIINAVNIILLIKHVKTIRLSHYDNFIKLEHVCNKFKSNMEKFHFNPIPLTYKTVSYFPNIETLHLWNEEDENFGNGLFLRPLNFGFHRDINKNNKDEKKMDFYRVIVWFNVDYSTVNNNYKNIIFRNVTYTKIDRQQFGNVIPPSVTSLGEYCFGCCSALNNVVIPSNVTSLGEYCFYECTNLSSITLPLTVLSFGDKCFYGCNNLVNVITRMCIVLFNYLCYFRSTSLSSMSL